MCLLRTCPRTRLDWALLGKWLAMDRQFGDGLRPLEPGLSQGACDGQRMRLLGKRASRFFEKYALGQLEFLRNFQKTFCSVVANK